MRICRLSLSVTDSIGDRGVKNLETIISTFSSVASLFTTAFTFIKGEPWLLVLVAVPICFWILGAVLSVFNNR